MYLYLEGQFGNSEFLYTNLYSRIIEFIYRASTSQILYPLAPEIHALLVFW